MPGDAVPARPRRRSHLTWVLVVAALALTGFNARSAWLRTRAVTPADARVSDWYTYAAAGQEIGPSTAPVRIVVFSDYECGACGQFEAVRSRLQARYGDTLAVVVRHLPLPSSVAALPAARAAVCAGAQGRFEELHAYQFAVQDSLGQVPWTVLAVRAGITDTLGFQRCLEDPATDTVLRRDHAAAERLGTTVTPTLLIGALLYRGLPADVERIVAQQVTSHRTQESATPSSMSRTP